MPNIMSLAIMFYNKKAELSQRRRRDAPNVRVLWNISRVLATHTIHVYWPLLPW